MYRDSLLTFVRQDLLKGKGDDLTAETPMIELGIIDSFSLFVLLAFIESEFGVEIPLGEVNAEDMRNINALATAIQKRTQE